MDTRFILQTFEQGGGIFRMRPNFVPRPFSKPGFRLRLHPDDYYALGTKRGAIKERWFSSVIAALNGPDAPEDEGLSYVSGFNDPESRFLFRDAVKALGADLIGQALMDQYGTWPMYSKFFDYSSPLFHHLHLNDEKASLVGKLGKPECYYFPVQLNNYAGDFPVTYFGFSPDVTREEVMERLVHFDDFDTRITELSRAYRLQLGTGWYTPAGVVHAPGSFLTYEPQWNSDVSAVVENVPSGEVMPRSQLVNHCPEDKRDDYDFIFSLIDWEKNVDPDYRRHYFRPPVEIADRQEGCFEKWIMYANPYVAAKELTLLPGKEATVSDDAAHGLVLTQGHGRIGSFACEAPTLIRFGQPTCDEFFVSEGAAKKGIRIVNESQFEPLVMLKHFGPNTNAPKEPLCD